MLIVTGSTGGAEDEKINELLYENSYDILIDTMHEINDFDLIAGGTAFSNHLAVKAFLEGEATSLRLYFPANFDGKFDEESRYGKIANHHHKIFKEKCNIDSLAEIEDAINKGAKVEIFKDFIQAGQKMLQCSDKMLVYTFSNTIIDDCKKHMKCKTNIQNNNAKDMWIKAKDYNFRRHVGFKGMRGFNE